MSNLGDLINNISDDLNRTDLTSQIIKFANRSINHYAKEPFWFTETTATFTLSAGQVSYSSSNSNYPDNVAKVHYVEMDIDGSDRELDEIDISVVQSQNPDDSQSDPTSYARWENAFYTYPIPNTARTVKIWYTKSYSTLSTSADTNDFLVYAEDLIEARTRWQINAITLKDRESAIVDKSLEQDALSALQSKNENNANTKIEPTCF